MRLIDADALTKNMESVCMGIMAGTESYRSPLKEIDGAPTVDPVKHGRWIKMTGMMPPEYHGHYECSECQWHMKGIRSSWTREEEFNYCPNCGAKMDEEDEDETD